MPRRSDEAKIQQIVDAADKIMRRSQSLSYDQFLEDDEKWSLRFFRELLQ